MSEGGETRVSRECACWLLLEWRKTEIIYLLILRELCIL